MGYQIPQTDLERYISETKILRKSLSETIIDRQNAYQTYFDTLNYPRWEYRTTRSIEELNELGKAGWELIFITDSESVNLGLKIISLNYFLKRPLVELPKEISSLFDVKIKELTEKIASREPK